MAIAVRHAQHLSVLGGWMSGLLGSYSLALTYGAYRVHRRFISAATSPESCSAPSSSPLQTLRQIFISPPPGLLLDGSNPTASALPSKVSLVILPGFCLACAALMVWRSRPKVHTLGSQQAPVDTAGLARLQREAKSLLERANLGRLLSNVFAVLFLWRMSSFYRQLGSDSGANDDNSDARSRFLRLWFSHALAMAGMGLVLGLLNLALYGAMQTQYRNMKHAIRHRVRAPTSGLRARAGMSSSAFTGL